MKYFIVEDDLNIIRVLSRIINDRDLGTVVGYSLNGNKASDEIFCLKPDIVLVDLFIPDKDGISIVKEIIRKDPSIAFIMISQVSSKDMIAKAYESGIEFYIQKPINAVEVENVIAYVKEKINSERKLNEIKKLFNIEIPAKNNHEKLDYEKKLKYVLQKIGIMGEAGTQDIIKIIKFLIDSNVNLSNFTIKEVCSRFSNNPKTVEQRIRRAAIKGMVNLAHLGIEDNLNDTFLEYSTGLYNFKEIKIEMDYIRGKGKIRGKVSIRKFIDGLLYYSKN
ncbi:DNA-binding domain-containing protein [Paramaledivibacter caminithermalis]|jgi:two-component system response regulator YcbB|uniref:Stage 0 sporulation protein A homolog n=1 Tax=Paramaledivibacter caminithermalis (strain DSM 15212 / CIP 107654 / DViRD3) TaxID=1121301 RepID=A0A1M6R8E9_PARC5|nr:DNA-binding domain-containing protein [Paramaledivibacter caminithermalis]SHK28710.1 two-component system, response regulator YcbB [Paramaledivibacter caminithermalis DSM 15212]